MVRGRGRGRPLGELEGHDKVVEMITNLQRRLEEQEAEIKNLRQQLDQQDELLHSEAKDEQELAPLLAPPAPRQMEVRQEPLYERFRRMRPPEFDGSIDPLVAEEWLSSIQTILDFMDLKDSEKVLCASYVLKKDARYWWETVKLRRTIQEITWNDFISEYNLKYYNRMAMIAMENEFINLKQEAMSVTEALRKFDQLARLFPFLVSTEEERVRRMLEMFQPELALVIESGHNPPTTVAECIERALRAEYRLAQVKEERNRIFDAKKIQKGKRPKNILKKRFKQRPKPGSKPLPLNLNKRKGNIQGQWNQKNQPNKKNPTAVLNCKKCRKNHWGQCMAGINFCYKCRKKGHYARGCYNKLDLKGKQGRHKAPRLQFYAMQAKPEGPAISQKRIEAPKPISWIYNFTNNGNGAEAGTSNVMTVPSHIAPRCLPPIADFRPCLLAPPPLPPTVYQFPAANGCITSLSSTPSTPSYHLRRPFPLPSCNNNFDFRFPAANGCITSLSSTPSTPSYHLHRPFPLPSCNNNFEFRMMNHA